MSFLNHESHPILSLTAAFTAWKTLLLGIALGASVGPDYDTSTSLFFDALYGAATPVPALATRLTRWDAIYFMHDAAHGKVYEQEWAFGIGLPAAARCIGGLWGLGVWEPLVAIAISHASHFIAVLSLYQLTLVLYKDKKLAFLASVLHILSPAGLFLSAPYAESPFSCLSFVANLLFAVSLTRSPGSLHRNVAVVTAGFLYGVSCTLRSNGLFGGVLFAVEVVRCLMALLDGFSFPKALRLIAPVLGGLLVAAGFIAPQVLAWIPLFLLAAPMLTLLIKSGTELVREPSRGLRTLTSGTDEQCRLLVQTLAAVQTLLAVLAITNYHVQIISRLSSGYPVWYWWVASCLMDKKRQSLGYGVVVFITISSLPCTIIQTNHTTIMEKIPTLEEYLDSLDRGELIYIDDDHDPFLLRLKELRERAAKCIEESRTTTIPHPPLAIHVLDTPVLNTPAAVSVAVSSSSVPVNATATVTNTITAPEEKDEAPLLSRERPQGRGMVSQRRRFSRRPSRQSPYSKPAGDDNSSAFCQPTPTGRYLMRPRREGCLHRPSYIRQ
ncbi:hypothetical protein F66182_3124 [Fusarium sp. NRRL 66182]|nr:hypothetical protein F66182_3124 [Fusarium sp. NRRL 66182]